MGALGLLVAVGCATGTEQPPAAGPGAGRTGNTDRPAVRCDTSTGADCALRQLADPARVRIGTAIDSELICGDLSRSSRAAEEFNSLTPENEMKWSVVRPTPDRWDWSGADAVVAFAEEHDQQVRGHTLVWGQAAGNGMPQWLRDLEDPAAFRAAVVDGITTQVTRYAGRVDRWDVVNEPLAVAGTTLDDNPYLQRLGPGYIDLALRTARDADPTAELWLNENLTEYLPAKADALVELVRGLRTGGTPLDGVGLQTHLTLDAAPGSGSVGDVVRRLRELGVEVAITELDVPVGVRRDQAEQTRLYGWAVDECLANGCREVTVWGVDDRRTWLDDPGVRSGLPGMEAFPVPTRPLLLDTDGNRKPAHAAVAARLAAISRPTTGRAGSPPNSDLGG